jgi:hypothetical protein
LGRFIEDAEIKRALDIYSGQVKKQGIEKTVLMLQSSERKKPARCWLFI